MNMGNTRFSLSGRTKILFAVSLASAAGLIWFLARAEPAVLEHAAETSTASTGTHSNSTALTNAVASTASDGRAALDPQAPEDPKVGSIEGASSPAGIEGAFLTVRVLQTTGEPAPRSGIQWIVRSVTGEVGEVYVKGESDREGLLAIEEQPIWWNSLFGTEPGPYRGMFVAAGLRSSLPYNEYAETELDEFPNVHWIEEEPPRDRPLDLVLPPSGFVRFEWDPPTDGLGAPLEAFHLHVRRSDGDYFPGWRTGIYSEEGSSSFLAGPFGLGWEVYGSLSSRGVVGQLGLVTAPGPTRVGQTVVLKIQIHDEHRDLVHLTGVATEDTGQALAETYLKLALADPEISGVSQISLLTGADGRWSLAIPRARLASPIYLTAPNPKPGRRGLAWHEPESLTGTVLDVGQVALSPLAAEADSEPQLRFLVAGRVQDTGGTPIPKALVQIESAPQAAGESEDSRPVWSYLTTVRTDAGGEYSFEFPAEPPALQLRITASHPEYRTLPSRQMPEGSANVDFTLQLGCSVSFPFTLPAWTAVTQAVEVSLQGPSERRYPTWVETPDGRHCVFSGLELGSHRLTVSLDGGDYVFVDEEIEVAGDIELEAVDLTEAIGICAAVLLDPSGQPIERRYVDVFEEPSQVALHKAAWIEERGRIWVAVPTSADSVLLEIRGVGRTRVNSSQFFQPGIEEPPEALVLTVRP